MCDFGGGISELPILPEAAVVTMHHLGYRGSLLNQADHVARCTLSIKQIHDN